jgi:2'-5' RNA ligase
MPRRNVRKLPLRPPLPRYAVVWLPELAMADQIERFRRRHDPLAAQLPAHLTLVFPFHSNLTAAQIAAHVRRIVASWPPLPVVFRDIEGLLDTFVLLMVRERNEALTQLHDKLYTRILKPHLRTDLDYTPHLTLGRATSAEHFAPMLEEADRLFGRAREWRDVLRELAVLSLHDDGKISIVQTIPLNHG